MAIPFLDIESVQLWGCVAGVMSNLLSKNMYAFSAATYYLVSESILRNNIVFDHKIWSRSCRPEYNSTTKSTKLYSWPLKPMKMQVMWQLYKNHMSSDVTRQDLSLKYGAKWEGGDDKQTTSGKGLRVAEGCNSRFAVRASIKKQQEWGR